MQNAAAITCKSCTSELKRIRHAVASACDTFGMDKQSAAAVVLAIDEACANVIRHSCDYSDKFVIDIQIRRDGDEAVFLLIDDCPPISEKELCPKQNDPLNPGGLGLHLIHRVMDQVRLLPHEGPGNWLEMRFKL